MNEICAVYFFGGNYLLFYLFLNVFQLYIFNKTNMRYTYSTSLLVLCNHYNQATAIQFDLLAHAI